MDNLQNKKEFTQAAPLEFKDLLSMSFVDSQWVAKGLIPAGAITMLSGEPGTYKSWLAYHLAVSVAAGERFLNHFETTQSPVLIVNEENPNRVMQNRFQLLTSKDELPIYTLSFTGLKLNSSESLQAFKSSITRLENPLIIFDSFTRIHGLAENDPQEMAKLFQILREEFANQKYSVLLLHHNRKRGDRAYNSAQEMRGSSDIYASLDCHLGIKRKSETLTIEQTKLREQAELDPFQIKIVSDFESVQFFYSGETPLPNESKGELAKAAIIQALSKNTQMNKEEIYRSAQLAGYFVGKTVLLNQLNLMIKNNEVVETKGMRNSKVCSLSDINSVG